jgi:hypothetical protein
VLCSRAFRSSVPSSTLPHERAGRGSCSQDVLAHVHGGARPMGWGVGPSGRERFAQALLTFHALRARARGARRTGAGPAVSGRPDLQGRTAPDIGLGAMESAPAAVGLLTWHPVMISR